MPSLALAANLIEAANYGDTVLDPCESKAGKTKGKGKGIPYRRVSAPFVCLIRISDCPRPGPPCGGSVSHFPIAQEAQNLSFLSVLIKAR
jgi:hypothetical protein